MAKLLCSLLLAGFLLQANAFSFQTEEPEMADGPLDFIFSFLPEDLVSTIKSLYPTDLFSFIASWLPDHFLTNVLSFFNPLNYVSYIGTLLNPLTYIKAFINFNNPFYWLRFIGIDIHPLDWIPNPFKYLPNPFSIIPGLGQDRCSLQVHRGEACKDSVERYYFDQNTQTCMKFQYGGCGGNRNRFNTRRDCEQACRGH